MPIGDVDDPLFSVSRWYQAFVKALGRSRTPDEPMFLARDASRAYTYRCLRSDLRHWLERTGGDTALGPHGLRVLGYNLSKLGNGVELTVAHGGWMSEGHSRYERFSQVAVLGIPAGMLGLQSGHGSVGQPRDISRGRTVRGTGLPATLQLVPDGYEASDSEAEAEPHAHEAVRSDDGAPPGYTRERRTSASGTRAGWLAPDGARLPSKPAAWRHYASHTRRAVAPSDSREPEREEAPSGGGSPEQPSPARRTPRVAVPRRRARIDPSPPHEIVVRTAHGGEPSSPSEIIPEHERPPLRQPPRERHRG